MHTTSCSLKQRERERRDKEVLVFGIGACAWETEKKARKEEGNSDNVSVMSGFTERLVSFQGRKED